MKAGSEKPWYTPMVIAFLRDDVPRVLDIPQHLVARDVTTLVRRLSAEGEGFLTKTLPSFGKSIDLALQGAQPLATPLFKKRGRSALPSFLSALLRRVFQDDGWVRDEPCLPTIRVLRQLCLWCKKLQKGYSDESLQKAIVDFIEVDKALPNVCDDSTSPRGHLAVARVVVERIFRDIGDPSDYRPSHGPGAVAGGEGVIGKRGLENCFTELEKFFRPVPWFRSLSEAACSPECVYNRPKFQHGLSRIAFVEKDSSGPRTIGLEPAEYMWCQQALKRAMYDHIEKRSIARGHVNFTDQTINRRLARDWSRYDTLDMSKASDRNSLALVQYLFGRTKLWPYLQASRTPGTVLPDGSVLMYKKFAPMGSAVCFPVQAVVYYSLAVAALHLSGMPLYLACRNTYVYGDDLIVPTGYFPLVNSVFEACGLKFNTDKCCIHGRFRESCGLDAYDGVEVTPVRFRLADMRERIDFAKLVKHQNALHDAGYWCAANELRTTALSLYSDLRSLKLGSCDRKDLKTYPLRDAIDKSFGLLTKKASYAVVGSLELPILSWRCHEHERTVKARYSKSSQLFYVTGWTIRAKRAVSPLQHEVRHLRESLSRGGPVGVLVAADHGPADSCDDTKSVRRELELRYAGTLRKRKCVIDHAYSS